MYEAGQVSLLAFSAPISPLATAGQASQVHADHSKEHELFARLTLWFGRHKAA